MRFCLFLLAPALFAQPQIQPPHNYWRLPTPQSKKFFFAQPSPAPVVVAPNRVHVSPEKKVCSIPLINALKDKSKIDDEKMVVPLPNGKYAMKYVTPPAPPCDDEKR
jgi:hypothetical protein